MTRGLFIVLEGVNGCGKTTQAQILCDNLNNNGIPSVIIKYPDQKNPIGKTIRTILENGETCEPHALHMLFSAERWYKQPMIEEYLNKGVCVIADRYFLSGIAYSIARFPHLPPYWWWQCEKMLIIPDIIVYLKVDSETSSKRCIEREEKEGRKVSKEMIDTSFIDKLIKYFDSNAEVCSSGKYFHWYIQDGSCDKNQISENILSHVLSKYDSLKDSQIYYKL